MNQRDLWSWKATKSNEWLAGQCVMRYKAVVKFDSHGKETIRFVKQCYGFEHIRVMSYASWRNMSAIVLATTYFTAAWLGRGVRKDVLVAHIEHMHQRFNEVPEFFLYALAAGIKRAFVRYGNWETKAVVKKKDDRRIPRRRRPEGIGYKGCRHCRDGTSCRTLASDSQRSSEEAGSPASEEARGCKRRRDLRTQPAVLSRQGRLNEVRCLE